LPPFIAEPDFMSLDFVSLLDEPEDIEPDEPAPELEPEDIEPEVLPEPAAPDFVSVEDGVPDDFVSVEDEPAPVPLDVAELPVLGLAAGDDDDLSVLLEVEPDAPVEPEAPVEPAAPVEPEAPVEHDTPVEPEVEPDAPVEPEVEPDAPVEPDVESDAPDELLSVLGLAEGDFVSGVLFVSAPGVAGVFVSALEPLPPLAPLLAPPAPLVCASADVASIAPATVSAKALIHVFITVPPDAV